MQHLIPKPLHRLMLPMAHKARHHWRRWRKVQLHAVAMVVTDNENRVLLVRHTYGPTAWSVPGGGLGKGEAPELAAQRELFEELGYRCDALDLLGVIEEVVSQSPQTTHVYHAQVEGQPSIDRREIAEARFFPLDQLPDDLSRFANTRLAKLSDSLR